MNNNLICQFYVILGNRTFVPPVNNNVYINATDIHDIKELSDKILNSYKEKAKLGIKVGSEIIFLIPNEKYRTYTEDVIKKLKVNGKIELMAPKVIPQKQLTIKPTPTPSAPPSKEIKEKKEEVSLKTSAEATLKKEEKDKTNLKETEKTPIYHPTDNIYRGTVDSTTYNNFQKPKKSNKVAIIIFIISLIFFIVSLILLLFA